jgi:hypothetical protein
MDLGRKNVGEIVEALKKNKYLTFELSEIIMFLNDETLQRLADTGKTHVVTTAALYHLSAVCHEIWGKRKVKGKDSKNDFTRNSS